MNPIYKFQLTANGNTKQAFPVYGSALAKDFEKESGQQFFRAKLSGQLTFERDDFDFIDTAAFDTEFGITIFISYDAGQTWTSYWRGAFWKTDCTFNADDKTVTLTPTVSDEYTDILAGLEKEYNLLELAPEIVSVKMDKRPMIQIYVPGDSVIACFLSGMWWEQECDPESDESRLTATGDGQLNFAKISSIRTAVITNRSDIVDGFFGTGVAVTRPYSYTTGDYRFDYVFEALGRGTRQTWSIYRISDNTLMWQYVEAANNPSEPPLTITLQPVSGTGTVVVDLADINVYGRYICDVDAIGNQPTYQIATDDIVPDNRNYTRVIGYAFADTIAVSGNLSSTPTQWGIYQPGQYYVQPYSITGAEFFPISRSSWGRYSLWFNFSIFDTLIEQQARKQFTLRDAFPLSSVISVLLQKVAPGIVHSGTTEYSQFMYGINPITDIETTLLITPKSNLVRGEYDQPAQKAPIKLKDVFDMLRDCFCCYWFIEGRKLKIEHIQYFRNGGSYSGTPTIGRDLTVEKVTRNGKEWAFATSKYSFDKPEMAARYQFGWMDDVTQLFDGYPIDILSKYVTPENIEEINISQFTSDVDYILLNPGAISEDGFALLAATHPKETKTFGTQNWQSVGAYLAGTYKITCISGGMTAYMLDDGVNHSFLLLSGQSGQITIPDTNNLRVYTVANTTIEIIALSQYKLPYVNWRIGTNDHILQNGYLAFAYLQQYYAFDMPAPNYEINGESFVAQGIKKLKSQDVSFPCYVDPNLVQLVKTNMGNGSIEKLSVNLSSRNAETTLKYDTE